VFLFNLSCFTFGTKGVFYYQYFNHYNRILKLIVRASFMAGKNIQLSSDLHNYLINNSLRESELLAELRAETSKLDMAIMQIAPEQGQFMRMLLRLMQAKNAIEIGVFTGYSSICLAEGLASEGKLIACDVSEEWTSIAKKYWQKAGLQAKIDLRLAPALETLDNLLEEGLRAQFDFVFIDADKSNYWNYYERSLQLIKSGGLIVVDNVLWSGDVLDVNSTETDTKAIIEFNKKIHVDDRVEISMLAIADGLSLLRKC